MGKTLSKWWQPSPEKGIISGAGSAAGGSGLIHPVIHQLESTKPSCLEAVSSFSALSWRSGSGGGSQKCEVSPGHKNSQPGHKGSLFWKEKATKLGLCVLSLILQPRVLNLGIGLVKKQFLFIFNVSGVLVVLVEKTLKSHCMAF